MYELVQLSEHDYYVDCPTKIGVVRTNESDVVAIDSGNDKDAAKKLLKLLDARGWKLSAVFNTHSHADHIGGNRLLQDRTGCRLYAKGMECSFANRPVLEPMGLFGGQPLEEMKNKFLMAQEASVEPLTEDVLPEGWELIDLRGHSFDMAGFKTPDGNVFLADCVSSAETLEKYGIFYLWDPEDYIETLERVKTLKAPHFIPAHAPVTDDIVYLAQLNIDAVRRIEEMICGLCEEPTDFETLLKKLLDGFKLTMTLQQYALTGSTLRSYLCRLKKEGRVACEIRDNYLLWKKI